MNKQKKIAMLSRRHVLGGASALLGAAALRGFAIENPSAAAHFTHGVASGDPLADRVVLWTRVIPGAARMSRLDVIWEMALDGDFKTLVAGGETVADLARDYTVKLDVGGLSPATTYYYRFRCAGETSMVGRTRTLAQAGMATVRLGVASCASYPHGYYNAYRDMAAAELDAVVFLGDYIYEYAEGSYGNDDFVNRSGRRVRPAHEIITRDHYRQRYGLYRADPALQAAHAAHPWIVVWDDHELTNNTWKNGAQNHNPGEGAFAERIHAARQAWHEWMPVRTTEAGDQAPIYRSFQFGDLAQLIMLDTRLHGRDEQLDYRKHLPADMEPAVFRDTVINDPQRQMLGEDQESWLQQRLQGSTARWQVVGQQVIMGQLNAPAIAQDDLQLDGLPEYAKSFINAVMGLGAARMPLNLDAWDGYPASRERVLEALKNASNPVVLAGDSHNAWAFNLSDAAGDAVGVELATAGISSPGMERYLPIPEAQLRQALLDASPQLLDADIRRRGWSELTLSAEQALARWHLVSTVTDEQFEVDRSRAFRCADGARRWTAL